MDDVVCRPATPADVPAIAGVRIRSWQAAYRGSVPQDYLDALDVDAEIARRAGRPLDGQHVAVVDGSVVGWLGVGPYRADEGEDVPGPSCGEIAAIYALPERSEEHTSELQSPVHLVFRPLLEKKKHQQKRGCRGEADGAES